MTEENKGKKAYYVEGIRFHGYIPLGEVWYAFDEDDLCYKLAAEAASIGIDNYISPDFEEVVVDAPRESS